MNDQKILDSAPPKQGKWPDCNQVDSDGKWSHRQPVIRSVADIKELVELRNEKAELKKLLSLVKKDLLMRAEEDSDGCKVVNLSSFIWIKLKETLKAGN
jgi:hypothetical protein